MTIAGQSGILNVTNIVMLIMFCIVFLSNIKCRMNFKNIAAISGSIAMFEFLWINIISSAKAFFDTIPDIKFIISVVIIVLVWWIVGRYIFSGEEHPVKVWLEMAESLLFLIYRIYN